MNSQEYALDMLMMKVSSADERLSTIVGELSVPLTNLNSASKVRVWGLVKDLRNELRSALSQARHASTTELPSYTQTRLTNTSNDILEAIRENALLIARNTQMIALLQDGRGKVLKTGDSGKCGCEKWIEKECIPDDEH